MTNVGTGIARRATMIVIPLTSKGFGFAVVLTPMPVSVGDLNPGQSRNVRIELSVPPSVKELLLVQAGAFLNVKEQPGLFSGVAKYTP